MGLTDEGGLLHRKAQAILDALDGVVDEVRDRKGLVAGDLRVQAPLGFGRRYIAPLIAEFHSGYPNVNIALTLSDRPNRAGHSAQINDVIIHIGELADSSQIAVPIAPNSRILCAAPAYTKRYGVPSKPTDLLQHKCLVLRENDEDVTLWHFFLRKKEESVRVNPALISNDGEVIHHWALAGKGIILRSEWDVAEDLKRKHLVQLLPEYQLPTADIVALVPSARGVSARSKRFVDYIQSRFRPIPPWRAHLEYAS